MQCAAGLVCIVWIMCQFADEDARFQVISFNWLHHVVVVGGGGSYWLDVCWLPVANPVYEISFIAHLMMMIIIITTTVEWQGNSKPTERINNNSILLLLASAHNARRYRMMNVNLASYRVAVLDVESHHSSHCWWSLRPITNWTHPTSTCTAAEDWSRTI